MKTKAAIQAHEASFFSYMFLELLSIFTYRMGS